MRSKLETTLRPVAASLLLLALIAPAFPQAPGRMPARTIPSGASSLEITLKTDKNAYRLGEQVSIQVLLFNRSKATIYVYAPLDLGESASLSLWLKEAASGKDIPSEFVADALPPPPGSKDDFVPILPNHVYGVIIKSTLAQLNAKYFGVYDLTVEYHSPIPRNMSFGLPIWAREDGIVSSSPIRIKVGG